VRLPAATATLAALAMLAAPATPAFAHGPGLPVGPDDLWHHWTFDPWVLVPLFAVHWLYGRGVLRLWARAGTGRGVSRARVGLFFAGEVALVVALVTPLDPLGETLLTAHMIQHGLLIAIAPPLLLFGRPGAALPWGLPTGLRRGLTQTPSLRGLARRLSVLLHPLVAAALHGVVLWAWHAPALFDAALENRTLHWIEHLTFFGTAMLFWQSLFLASRSAATIPAGLGAAFATLVHGGLLGALITFAPHPLFSWYDGRTVLWGMTPLEDQQLGGLVMWVPLGLVYLAACLALVGRLVLGPAGLGLDDPSAAARPAGD
jgi:putative membrane protein